MNEDSGATTVSDVEVTLSCTMTSVLDLATHAVNDGLQLISNRARNQVQVKKLPAGIL